MLHTSVSETALVASPRLPWYSGLCCGLALRGALAGVALLPAAEKVLIPLRRLKTGLHKD